MALSKASRQRSNAKTLIRASQIAGADLAICAKANHSQCFMYDVGIADDDCADLVGVAETDTLSIDWPEDE